MKTTVRKMSLSGAALLAAVCLGGGISAWQNSALQVRAEETSYTAVTDEAGTLTGFYTANPIEGALYVGTRPSQTLSSEPFLYSLTEIQLGTNTIFDYESGGIVLHLSTFGNTAPVRTRIYVFANGYDGNLFFARGGNENSVIYPILDETGAKVGEFKGVKNELICTVDPGVAGTVTIPWTDMTRSGVEGNWASDNFPDYNDWRVAVHTDVGATGTAGQGIAIRSIASYAAAQEGGYTVVEGFNAADAEYSYDAATAGEVNLADVTAGTAVSNTTKWTTAISVRNYAGDDDGSAAAFVEYGRVAKIEYKNAEGESIRAASHANVRNIRSADGEYTFEIEAQAPDIAGYENPVGSYDVATNTVTYTYESVLIPQVTVQYADPYGAQLQAPQVISYTLDDVSQMYSYEIVPEEELTGGYRYVGATGELNGSIAAADVTEDNIDNLFPVVTLTYAYGYGLYDDYEIVNEADDSFAGIGLTKPMDKALYLGIRSDAQLPNGFVNAITEFRLEDAIHDHENGGLLIQFSTEGYTDFTTCGITVFAETNGGGKDFYSVVGGVPVSRTDTLIYEDGTIGSIAVRKSNSMYSASIPANTSGTWNIRWKDVLNNMHGAIDGDISPELRVLVWTDLSNASAYQAIGNGVSIGTIATYQKVGDVASVVEGISTSELTYTYDAENTEADVNMADISKGTRVYNTHEWNTAFSYRNYLPDEDRSTIDLVEYGRISTVSIPVQYLDTDGKKLGADGMAKVMYAENGLQYTVTVPEFTGYIYQSADRALEGVIGADEDVSGLVIRLTYARRQHTVTFLFVDEEGNEIAPQKQVMANYGEYYEFTADEIDGYTFKESSRKLNMTVLNDYTVTLVYTKNANNGVWIAVGIVGGILVIGAAVAVPLVIRKKKKA